jgi:carbon-monoxide dehydrogenase medium subunit
VSVAAYVRPATIAEAVDAIRAADDTAILAGGTALSLLRKQGLIGTGRTVDLGWVAGLDAIEATDDGGLRIGAMATLRAIETGPLVRERAPALAAVVARVATVRIRNQATIGGNLAHADPAQDPPPILLVLDAAVEIVGPAGTRRVPLDEFFVDVFETVLGPDEILTAVLVPPVPRSSRIGFEKFLPRTADDYATVSVAARLDVGPDGSVGDARLALGAVAAVPLRIPAAEALLRGGDLAGLPIAAAAEAVVAAIDPIDDARGSADYKLSMAGVWTRRLLERLAGSPAGRVGS